MKEQKFEVIMILDNSRPDYTAEEFKAALEDTVIDAEFDVKKLG